MPTRIYTKKRFMEFLSGLKDDDVIMLSGEMEGVEYKKKKNAQTVTMAFAADAFERKDTVGHFVKMPIWCFCIMKRENLSEGAQKIYDEIAPKPRKKQTIKP